MFKNNFSGLTLVCLLSGSALAQTVQPLAASNLNSAASNGTNSGLNRSMTTIGELVRTGQLRRTAKEKREVIPAQLSNTAPASAPLVPVSVSSKITDTTHLARLEGDLQLLTTFDAVGLRRAQLRVSSDDIMVDVGDRIKGGWRVSDIATASVHLKRCIKNQCDEKTLHLGDD